MKKSLIIVIVCIVFIGFGNSLFSGNNKEENKYRVTANVTGNDNPSSEVTSIKCTFNIYSEGVFQESIVKEHDYIGDDTYLFLSNYSFDSNDSWTYTLEVSDGLTCIYIVEGSPSSWNEFLDAVWGNCGIH